MELQPNCAEAHVNLGNVLHAQEKLSVEQLAYYAALKLKLGMARKKAGDGKTAIAYYRQAIALQPDLGEAYYNLGVVLQTQGELAEAIASYEKVLELHPDNDEVCFNLAKIYQQQKNFPKVIAAYRLGLKIINPQYAVHPCLLIFPK
ncbi:hypothetical protein BV375_30720 [Nostoc sp. 106C]|nr:hypothetical protein BV375_30720 [Nostoc sp. 106C]